MLISGKPNNERAVHQNEAYNNLASNSFLKLLHLFLGHGIQAEKNNLKLIRGILSSP
jgi:hypothetical protein